MNHLQTVIPAKAGISCGKRALDPLETPACAGVTSVVNAVGEAR